MRSYLFESITEPRNPLNWGVFAVMVPDEIEWAWQSHVKPSMEPILAEFGWTGQHVLIMDVQTGEAAMFRPDSDRKEWLDEHRIWVSPQFKPFLAWLAGQDLTTLYQLPGVIELPDATFALRGWREIGPHPVSFTLHEGDLIQLQWGGEIHAVICEEVTPDGARVRSLSPAEARELMGGPDDEEAGEDDEPHELDYEEMREGLPPPGTGALALPAPGEETETIAAPDETQVLPADEELTQVIADDSSPGDNAVTRNPRSRRLRNRT